MLSRRFRQPRHRVRLAAAFLASAPLPAFAADPALSAWGAYLFFAIVATVVIVLLLHEALEDEPTDSRRRDERVADAIRNSQGAESAFASQNVARDTPNRRIA